MITTSARVITGKQSPFLVGAANQERATVTQPVGQRQGGNLPTNSHHLSRPSEK